MEPKEEPKADVERFNNAKSISSSEYFAPEKDKEAYLHYQQSNYNVIEES